MLRERSNTKNVYTPELGGICRRHEAVTEICLIVTAACKICQVQKH